MWPDVKNPLQDKGFCGGRIMSNSFDSFNKNVKKISGSHGYVAVKSIATKLAIHQGNLHEKCMNTKDCMFIMCKTLGSFVIVKKTKLNKE